MQLRSSFSSSSRLFRSSSSRSPIRIGLQLIYLPTHWESQVCLVAWCWSSTSPLGWPSPTFRVLHLRFYQAQGVWVFQFHHLSVGCKWNIPELFCSLLVVWLHLPLLFVALSYLRHQCSVLASSLQYKSRLSIWGALMNLACGFLFSASSFIQLPQG